jgi:hypothetical protein
MKKGKQKIVLSDFLTYLLNMRYTTWGKQQVPRYIRLSAFPMESQL